MTRSDIGQTGDNPDSSLVLVPTFWNQEKTKNNLGTPQSLKFGINLKLGTPRNLLAEN